MRVRWEKGVGVHGRYDPETDTIIADSASRTRWKVFTLTHELVHKMIHKTFHWNSLDSELYQGRNGETYLYPRYFLTLQFNRWLDELDWLVRTGDRRYPVPIRW